MKGVGILLKLSVLSLVSVCAISPLPKENGTSSFPTSIHPSNLTAPIPPDPPNFNVHIDFADNVPMKPLSLYFAVIQLMYLFSVQPWAEHVNLTKAATLTYSDLTIVTIALRGTALTAGHCVLTLHKIVYAVYGPPARYDYVVAAITLQGSQIGQMIIDTFEEYHHKAEDGQSVPVVSNQPPTSGNSSLTLDNSGTITDGEYPALHITYHYDGRHIRSEEIFTAVLDGLTTLAPYDQRSNQCASVTGISRSGTVDFHVTSTKPGTKVTSCFVLARALVLVSLGLMVPAKRYRELDFSVEYIGTEVATGYVYMSRLPRVGEENSNDGITSS